LTCVNGKSIEEEHRHNFGYAFSVSLLARICTTFFKFGLGLDAMGLVFVAMGTTLSLSNTSFGPGFELLF